MRALDPNDVIMDRLERIESDLRQVLQVLDDLREQLTRPRFVTLKQAEGIFDIGVKTLRQHVNTGRLPAFAPGPGGTKLLVSVADVEKLVRAHPFVPGDIDLEQLADDAVMEVTKLK